MYLKFLLLFSLLNDFSCLITNETVAEIGTVDVSNIADIMLSLLGHDGKNETQRIQQLKEKLAKVDSYVVDREKYAARLSNESKLYFLNETNFYSALNEKDQYKFRNDSRNLYLKLKEKMNRDDILQILAERGTKKTKKSARRMMEHMPKRRSEQDMDDAVDKFLGEFAYDDHNFRAEDLYSKYWDPEPELKEREAYHQPSGGRRIFKGERTNILYYPFMTSIHLMGRFWCGGVLYWNDIVLTSAACLQLLYNNRFYRENPKVLAVRIGSNHSRFGGEMVPALEVFFHPSYNPKTLDNNIAVIRLQRMVKLSYHRVPKLIPISDNDQGVAFTSEVLLLGWGVQKTSQKLVFEPMYLARKFLPVYPNTFCKEVYGEKFNRRTMFCVGTMSTGEGACAHDAGGPAILAGKVVGIISYGPAICGYPDAPTVLTLVAAYVDWIETINETMPDYYRAKARTTSTTIDPYLMYFQEKTTVSELSKKFKEESSLLKDEPLPPPMKSAYMMSAEFPKMGAGYGGGNGPQNSKLKKKSGECDSDKEKDDMVRKKPAERTPFNESLDTMEEMREIMAKLRKLRKKKHRDDEENMKKIDAKIEKELNIIRLNAARGNKDSKTLPDEINNSNENSKDVDIVTDTTGKVENSPHKVVPVDANESEENKVKDKNDAASSSNEGEKVKERSFEQSFSVEHKTANDNVVEVQPIQLVNNRVRLSDA